MNDTPSDDITENKTASPFQAGLRKLAFTLVVLLALWLVLRLVVAPMMFSPSPAAPASVSQPAAAPAAHVEEASPMPEQDVEQPDRLAQLEARLNGLEAALKESPPATAIDEASMQPYLAPLQQRIEAQEAELQRLRADLAALEKQSGAGLAAMNGFSQLQAAAQKGLPYDAAFKKLSQLLGDDPEMAALLDALAPYAATGAPTLSMLQADFESNIAMMDENAAPSFAKSLRSLIRIRKVGANQQGADDDAVIARAEAQLAEGNAAAALQELAQLSPVSAKTMQPWMEKADAYLVVNAALLEIERILPEKTAGAANPTGVSP